MAASAVPSAAVLAALPPGRSERWEVGLFFVLLIAGAPGYTGRKMVQLHLLENLYCNALAGPHPELRYGCDYWSLSLQQVAARPVRVRTNAPNSLVYSACLLPLAVQARPRSERDVGAADYFITTYRYHPRPYPLVRLCTRCAPSRRTAGCSTFFISPRGLPRRPLLARVGRAVARGPAQLTGGSPSALPFLSL